MHSFLLSQRLCVGVIWEIGIDPKSNESGTDVPSLRNEIRGVRGGHHEHRLLATARKCALCRRSMPSLIITKSDIEPEALESQQTRRGLQGHEPGLSP